MQSRPSGIILPLTSVRFFAAMYVVLLHSATWSHHIDRSTWLGRFLASGYTAVGFFFVLSGYILAYVHLNADRPFSRRSFWVSRFARVYPLLVISLVLDLPNDLMKRLSLHSVGSAVIRSLVSLLSECALLQSWDGRFRNINAPSWSLSTEACFYLIFPAVAFWIWRRKGLEAGSLFLLFWGGALLVPLLLTALRPALFAEVDSSRLQWAVELMPIFRVFEFLAGIALCSIQLSLLARFTQRQLHMLASIFLVAAAVFFGVAIQVANHIPLLVMSNGLLLPAEGLLILGLTNMHEGPASLLSYKPMVILGESSYAAYLLHRPIWVYLSRVVSINSLSRWLVYLTIVLVLSVASFFFLERPARKKILAMASVRSATILKQEEVANG